MADRRFHAVLLTVWVMGTALSPADAQGTWRVSVDSSGGQGNEACHHPSVSANGRFVAFESYSSNLVGPFGNDTWNDIFVHDRQTRTTTQVSVSSSGMHADWHSQYPSISADGRFVAYHSQATNLITDDLNGVTDVFVHDRWAGTTKRVSVNSTGAAGNGGSYRPSISGDGRFVTFSSLADNLVPGDTNGVRDVFVHDCQTAATTRVSVRSSGIQGNDTSYVPFISGDGRFVSFSSQATNLVLGDTNQEGDVFVHDRQSGTTIRVSISSSGVEGNNRSQLGTIAAEGRHVAFESEATSLVPGDTNGDSDVFVHDLDTGTTTRVSIDSSGDEGNGSSGSPSVSSDGRFVAFFSFADLDPSGRGAGLQVYVHDREVGTTTRASVDSSGVAGNGNSHSPSISAGGRFVGFTSEATNLVPDDTNGRSDAFVHGPALTLEADPDTVTTGDPLTLTSWEGLPSGLAALFLTDLNGSPVFLRVSLGLFDSIGIWALSGDVPPGLSGNAMTFKALGFAPAGRIEISNGEVVTFL